MLTSRVTGVASLSNLEKLSRIGGKTIVIYLATTAIAVTADLIIVNILRPGSEGQLGEPNLSDKWDRHPGHRVTSDFSSKCILLLLSVFPSRQRITNPRQQVPVVALPSLQQADE